MPCEACDILRRSVRLRDVRSESFILVDIEGTVRAVSRFHGKPTTQTQEQMIEMLRAVGVARWGNNFALDPTQPWRNHFSLSVCRLSPVRNESAVRTDLRCARCGKQIESLESMLKIVNGAVVLFCPAGCVHPLNIDGAVLRI
jgi:hypothetical protein